MKKIVLLLVIVISLQSIYSQSTYERMHNNYVTAISFGVDPSPLFDTTSTGGLDMNLKVIFGQEHREYGLGVEYFHNLDYLSTGAFYDFIVLGQGISQDYYIQGLLGVEVMMLSRFNGQVLDLHTGFFGLTGGMNGTLRWNISNTIGIEGILNCKYRRDKEALWNEKDFNKLFPISGRLNLIITL